MLKAFLLLEFQNYIVRPNLEGLRIVDNKHNLPLSYYIGVCGMPGKTAYMAWKEYSQAKKVCWASLSFFLSAYRRPQGETAFVTTGAGPVGS